MKELARIEKKTIEYEITKTEPKSPEMFHAGFKNVLTPWLEEFEIAGKRIPIKSYKFAIAFQDSGRGYCICRTSASIKDIKEEAYEVVIRHSPIMILKCEERIDSLGDDSYYMTEKKYKLLETWRARRIK